MPMKMIENEDKYKK